MNRSSNNLIRCNKRNSKLKMSLMLGGSLCVRHLFPRNLNFHIFSIINCLISLTCSFFSFFFYLSRTYNIKKRKEEEKNSNLSRSFRIIYIANLSIVCHIRLNYQANDDRIERMENSFDPILLF